MTDFQTRFNAVTDHDPFPWQERLYDEFLQKRFPATCDIPTGLGKTSIVAIWLIAFEHHSRKCATTDFPRRLVYVVNRRTVVDQTTNEVQKLKAEFGSLAVSTLRGQYADNREWSADPSQPAVIAGTVDMIGSRLLFSGYGISSKLRPLHAGFLGQNVLLVHDEAHLEPAFQTLIEAIQEEQKNEPALLGEQMRLKVMELSATSRGKGRTHTLESTDFANPEVKKRIEAKKAIHLVPNKDEKKLAEEIAQLALTFKDSKRPVLIFVRKVDDVEKIVKQLPKGRVQQLTGTLRGLERDQLVEDSIFRCFLPNAEPCAETAYLVCTSAGEVGVNISADHLICDLSTFDSMAQRFGRANRFGNHDDTEIHVIHPNEFEKNDGGDRLNKTLDLLRALNDDGSPKALGRLNQEERLAAFAPPPKILPTSDILFDSWALTTIHGKLPGRPPVEPYLHGIERDQPETYVAWREEVGIITGDLRPSRYKPIDLLEDYPLKPHEVLRDTSSRVFDRLKKLKAPAETPVWIVSEDDSVTATTLGEVVSADKDMLNYKTVLLPPSAGGLKNGFLTSDSTSANDVADEWRNEAKKQRRVRIWDDDTIPDGMRLIRPVIDTQVDDNEPEEESFGRRFWYWYELPKASDGEGSKSDNRPVSWQVHTDDVIERINRIAKILPISEGLRKAIELAARFHDLGKKRELWQRSIGNPKPKTWLAKSGGKMKPIELTDYRHEFGSLVDVLEKQEFKEVLKKQPEDVQDLVLHLIAAHHGYARPHFPSDRAIDPEHSQSVLEKIATEVPQRFLRLQRKYGRWGLAYLESLLRAADYAASASPSAFTEDK